MPYKRYRIEIKKFSRGGTFWFLLGFFATLGNYIVFNLRKLAGINSEIIKEAYLDHVPATTIAIFYIFSIFVISISSLIYKRNRRIKIYKFLNKSIIKIEEFLKIIFQLVSGTTFFLIFYVALNRLTGTNEGGAIAALLFLFICALLPIMMITLRFLRFYFVYEARDIHRIFLLISMVLIFLYFIYQPIVDNTAEQIKIFLTN